MWHLFQDECLEKHPSGCSFGLLWLRKLAKALERKNGSFGTFIYENNENQEKMEVKGYMLHGRRKMKENNGKMMKIEALSIKGF